MTNAPAGVAAAERHARRDRFCIYATAFLRSLSVGLTGVLLAIYLHSMGWDVKRTGLLVSLGLVGAAASTLLVSFRADRMGRRRTLVVLGLLNALGGLALAWGREPGVLLFAAFFGMINGLGRDRGPAYALEQAVLPETTTPERRTFALAWYNMIMDAGLALGSLLGGLPVLLRHRFAWDAAGSYQAAWILYAGLAALTLPVYLLLSSRVEVANPGAPRPVGAAGEHPAKHRIYKLAALTGMDSLGGGFLTSALVSYWFFRRFGIGEEGLGLLFFGARVLNAVSHLAAAWLARRIGLVNTMVFTHIPSSLFLMTVPFAPSLLWATVFFLVREGLVEMDVPTRQSYILAVVPPEERAFASGITTFTRNVAYAIAPSFAGLAMSLAGVATGGLAFSAPLFLGGGIKITYDALLYFSFRHVKPPEETVGSEAASTKNQRGVA